MIALCIFIACALMHQQGREAQWRAALDAAQTPQELTALHDKIRTEMSRLAPKDAENAQRFLEVIERKLVKRPYEEEFRQYAAML